MAAKVHGRQMGYQKLQQAVKTMCDSRVVTKRDN